MAQDRLRFYAVVSILLTVGSQILGLVFVLLPGAQTATVFAWGGMAGRILAVAACLFLIRPRWFARGDGSVVRGAFALGLPITLGSLSMFVLNSGDRLVIQRILGSAEVGRYQVAYTIGFEAITVFAFTGQAWAARFAEIRDDARRWRLLGQARDHLYELLAPTLLAVNLAAPLALRIFAPASFRPEGLLLTVLVVSFAGVPTIAVLGSTRALIIQRRTKPIALAAGVAAAVNLGLNLALVPVIGLVGAAAATAVAFAVQAVILRLAFRPLRAWPRTPARIVGTLLVTSGVATAFAFVDQSPLWIVVRTGLAGLCGVWLVVTYLRGRSAHAPENGGGSRKPMARLTSPRTDRSSSVNGSDSITTDR
jgi:O-antigen/teichoic acid export membrane protein